MSYLARLTLALVIVAAVGAPGLQQLDLPAAQAQQPGAGARQPMPPGDAWTGDVPGSGATEPPAATLSPANRAGAGVDASSVGANTGATDASAISHGTQSPSGSTTAATDASPTEPLIVRFKPGAPHNRQVDAHVRSGAIRARAVALTDTVVVDVPAGRGAAALAAYNARPDVLYAEPDYEVRALYAPNDPQLGSQWAITKVGASAAWDVTRGVSSVRVAVVDCGVFSQQTGRTASDGQAGHPDLRGRVIMNQDFTGSSTGFDDYCDHGTHVAGIIGASGNNGVGISGLAPEVSLMNAKVLGDSGSGSNSAILNGVSWAVQNGAHVINMSLGRDGACSQAERDMMNYAWGQGVVVIAAAGNSSLGASGSPANCANVVSVASTTSSDSLSSFSNYGTDVDVAAPGSGILSTVRSGGYASYNGTSMASPYVAGLAGLIFSLNPDRSAQSVVDVIQSSSTQITGTGSQFAWGRINAAAAVGSGGSPGPAPTSTQPPTATATQPPNPTPTQVACPSPRPPVAVSANPGTGASFTATVRAGAGVIRRIYFTQMTNAAVTLDGQMNVTQPFSYTPSTYGQALQFQLTQRSPGQGATVGMTVVDDCGAWPTLVGAGAPSFQRGTVTGTVRNATNTLPIEGATVRVRGTALSDQTGANGVYSIPNVQGGARMLDITAPGFAGAVVNVNVAGNQTVAANASLTPTGSGSQQGIVVSLTWGASPADLDIHLSGPTTSGNRFHLYWNNPSAVTHAVLSPDQHNGYGPESITIRRSTSTGSWVPGEYRIWSHNYSGTPGYGSSSAKVTVSRDGATLGTYNASAASGNANRLLWRSVNVTVDASGNVSLTPIQQFRTGNSGTILRFEDGDETLEWPTTGKP